MGCRPFDNLQLLCTNFERKKNDIYWCKTNPIKIVSFITLPLPLPTSPPNYKIQGKKAKKKQTSNKKTPFNLVHYSFHQCFPLEYEIVIHFIHDGRLKLNRYCLLFRSKVLCVMFCRSLFVFLFIIGRGRGVLSCLPFFDLRILITRLVSSNSS